jgi:hypothetical protein
MLIAAGIRVHTWIMCSGSATHTSSVGSSEPIMLPRHAPGYPASQPGRTRLRVPPGNPGHLDHRQGHAAGEHDRHMQQRPRVRQDVASMLSLNVSAQSQPSIRILARSD